MRRMRSTDQSLLLQSLALWVLRLYPRRWRGRYEVEVQALLEEHAIRLRTVIDLLIGALDARLDPAYAQERSVLTMRSPRFTTVSLFCTFALFGIALLPLLALLLDPEYIRDVPTHYGDLVSAYPLVGLAGSAILVVSLIAGVALLATFLVLALGRISTKRGRSAIAWLLVTLVAALVLVVLVPALLHADDVVRQYMLALLGIVICLAGLGAALTQSQLGTTQWRALLVTAATTTLAMALIAIGAVTWLITVWLHASLLHLTYWLSLETGAVSALALATVIAVLVVSRAFVTRWGQNPLRIAS